MSGFAGASTSPATGTNITRPEVAMRNAPTSDRASFIAEYGNIFEHSPWIAERVWELGLHDGDVPELLDAFSDVILGAKREQQLALLRAHPQLVSAIASGEELTRESRGEQRGAGLDQCSAVEFEEFKKLNSTYSDKFGFPFIIAVRGLGREQILKTFRERLTRDAKQEFTETLDQVIRIGKFRLEEITSKQEAGHGS
jgi:2-oxo-4-hydroxy-4-carboxy-5-ureidoimidazoline decarboxylase